MKTINDMLKPSDFYILGNTIMYANKLMNDVAKLWRPRATAIEVNYIPSVMKANYRAIARKDGRIVRTTLNFDPLGYHNDR